jgi:ribosome biogenesis protein MAK21
MLENACDTSALGPESKHIFKRSRARFFLSLLHPMADAKSRSKAKAKDVSKAFTIEASSHWYTLVSNLDATTQPAKQPNAAQLADITDRAASLHAEALTAHTDVGTDATTSDGTFLQKILKDGTLSDRLSALTLLVQASPLHNTKALETLKALAERGRGKGGREESLKAIRAISDWWVGGGAPPRKLKYVPL